MDKIYITISQIFNYFITQHPEFIPCIKKSIENPESTDPVSSANINTSIYTMIHHFIQNHPGFRRTFDLIINSESNTKANKIYHFGETEKDKIFYVIRRSNCSAGLFSYFFTTLTQIRYALEMGWYPIVDMK